jgi:peptide/nickel transport system permease protein
MAETALPQQPASELKPERSPLRPWVRVARYITIRTIVLFLLLTVGVYVAVVVANLGGYVDEIYRDRISNAVMGAARGMGTMPAAEREAALEQLEAQLTEAYGLNQPFLLRCVRWLYAGLTLDLITPAIRAAFPNTLLLVSTSYLLLFFVATSLALYLSRRYGSLLDRLVTALSPLSAAPSWVHGIILVAIFAVELHVLPFNGMFDSYPPASPIAYVFVILRHMVLPVTAILLSALFQCVYAWRTFFLIHSSEDYVELARAKGLPDRMLERRYILRPALPYFVTSFALLLVSFWQESIALEYFFSWPGIGRLYIRSTMTYTYSSENIVGILTVFAYVLAITVFVLDIAYALLDPRVRIGGEGIVRPSVRRERGWRHRFDQAAVLRSHPVLPSTTTDKGSSRMAAPVGRRPRGDHWLIRSLREIVRFPSAMLGITMILALVGVSIYTVIALPYDQAVQLWKSSAWRLNPRGAQPAWVNWFRRDKLPETFILSTEHGTASKETARITDEMSVITVSAPLDYTYGDFPQDIMISMTARYDEKLPLAHLYWETPDGRQISLGAMQLTSAQTVVLSQDDRLARKLNRTAIQELFLDPTAPSPVPLQGHYRLLVKTYVFEPDSDIELQAVIYGKVFGLAGTDINRRDLMIAMLWGMPVALGLGLLGAVSSTLIAITVAAVGVWFGGWVDRIIQWVSEVNMLLPVLPLAIMVYFRYTKDIWAILAVIIILSSFGRALKNLRAALLQVRELPYIQAAQSYGAGNLRIILRYLIPRVIPVLVPQLVIMIPGFVFLEATLAIVGVSDLNLPTWGKVIYDALTSGAVQDHYYLVLEPIALLMLTGLAFAMLGYSLDRVFNPRLRSMRVGRE